MRRIIGLIAVVAAAALVVVAAASATSPNSYFLFSKDAGSSTMYHCYHMDSQPTGWNLVDDTSYDTKTDCMAAIPGPGGGDEGPWTATACDGAVVVVSDVSQEDADAQAAAVDCTATGDASGQAPPSPAGIFLCYSTDQVTPSVWPAPQAALLLAGGGYWQAYAVKGNVAGGTNVGGYHLVCNLATGQAVGGQFSDEGGVSSNANDHNAIEGALGWYSVISG